jgi:hypothetical protein
VTNTEGVFAEYEPQAVSLPYNGGETYTSETQIHVVWDALATQAEMGGVTCTIYSYNLDWDRGTQGASWFELIGVESIYTSTDFIQDEDVTSSNNY